MNNNQFTDPLDEIINKHREATQSVDNTSTVSESTQASINEPDVVPDTTATDIIDYGENDLAEEIAREEHEENEMKQNMMKERKSEKSDVMMPPDEHDMAYHTEALAFQSDKLAVVTTMVNKVIAKHHIISGGIPTENNVRMRVMGELIDIYHKTGDVITPEFEKVILDNWVDDSGVTATELINRADTQTEEVKKDEEKVEPILETPTVNITVEKNNPVTINVDESLIANTSKSNVINVNVKEVSEKELRATTIIENSQQEGIITTYDSGISDVPITLPMSGYRCVMRPINWFDFIRLTAPTSKNSIDNELKKWSVIYEHMKNPSIGPFENFDDFLKKTKYQDGELLMWAILVATSDEEEPLNLTCRNDKCKSPIKITYRPRSIIHLDEERIPKHYEKTHSVAVGEEAIKHWESVNSVRTRYELPDSGIIVEVDEPSAYDFITKKLPLVQEIFERYHPGKEMGSVPVDDPSMFEFDYLSANALYVSAMTIIRDGKEYRYTHWDDIEHIITKALGTDDSRILLKIVENSRLNVSPASFYIENIVCPKCKLVVKKQPIENIGTSLLFQVSRRLGSTTINLIKLD